MGEPREPREPLEGTRVVEVAVGVAAPIAGVFLADMGAEVIKIEPPGGDGTRSFRGRHNTLPPGAPTPWSFALSRGKKSLELDLATPDGQEAAHRLLATADVFLTNHRHDGLRHMALDYETLHSSNPRLVYAISSGYGPHGPDADAAVLDVAVQARGGLCHMVGPADQVPMMVGTVVGDTSAGMLMALGIMTALVVRQRTGEGQRVDTSALGAQLFLQAPDIDQASMTGQPLSRDGRFAPNVGGLTGVYATADGRGLALGRIPPGDWPDFCRVAGLPEFVDHPLWGNAVIRAGLADRGDVDFTELRRALARAISGRSLDEWVSFFDGRRDVVFSAVQTYEEVVDDPQVIANDYLVEADVGTAVGSRPLVGQVVGFTDSPATAKTGLAAPGEHTAEVLSSLGYTDEGIARLIGQLDAGYHRLAKRAGYTDREMGALS